MTSVGFWIVGSGQSPISTRLSGQGARTWARESDQPTTVRRVTARARGPYARCND